MNGRVTLGVRTSWLFLIAILALVAPIAASAQSLPSGWSARDIGSVGASGSSSGSGGSFTLRGSGADVWDTADGFQFAYRSMSGDGEIITHVRSVDYLHAWSKAGVMMRESLSAGAKHAFMLASAGKGDAFQRRPYTNGSSVSTVTNGGPGYYVKITRQGNNFDAYQSADGSSWGWVGSEWIDMPTTVYVGVAVTSHYYGALATATFSETAVNEWTSTAASGSALPGGWAHGDIGGVAASGWAAASGNEFQVGGSGYDIWNNEDSFQFAYRTMSGDGSIVARVSALDWVDSWTKGGVMMRESLSPSSAHAYTLISAGKGVAFQRRPATGSDSLHTEGTGAAAPYYVKLVRSGNTFTGYSSPDGSNWTWVGNEYISMGSTIYVGLAVTSHANGAIANGTFSGVEVVEGAEVATVAPPAPAPAPPPAPAAGGDGSTFRVMQWNVHHGGIGTDGYYKPERIAAWIAYVNPEVVTMNEVDDESQLWNIVSYLQAQTGVTWHATFAYKNAVLTRLPVLNQNYCGYGYTSGQTSPQTGILVNGRAVGIWAAHLDADSAYARWSEIGTLQYCLNGWSSANIIAGDFNMQAASPEYWTMLGGYPGYIDAWDTARNNGATFNYSGNCDGCTRNSRIDYMFSSSSAWFLTVDWASMIDTRDAYGYMPSDHKPFVITYRVR